jgi:hypothetical protein
MFSFDISKLFKNFLEQSFQQVSKSRIVKELNTNFFAVIETEDIKGNGKSIRWGFLIGKVARESGKKFDLKTSYLDLSYDPLDYTTDTESFVAYNENELQALSLRLSPQVMNYFKDVHEPMNLFHLYQEKTNAKSVRFKLENYPQEKFAYEKLVK